MVDFASCSISSRHQTPHACSLTDERLSPWEHLSCFWLHPNGFQQVHLCVSLSLQVLVEQASDRRLAEQDSSGLLRPCVADTGADPQRYPGGWESPPTGTWLLPLLLLLVSSHELCSSLSRPVLCSDSRRLLQTRCEMTSAESSRFPPSGVLVLSTSSAIMGGAAAWKYEIDDVPFFLLGSNRKLISCHTSVEPRLKVMSHWLRCVSHYHQWT